MIGSPDHPAALLDPIEGAAHDWVTRFAAGDATAAELESFKQWSASNPAHTEAFVRACRLWEALGAAAAVPPVEPGKIVAPKSMMRRRAVLGGALAASAAAASYLAVWPPLGLWPSVEELAADYRTGIGEQRRIALAGGPSVELNTRTSIAFQAATRDGPDRIELIAGEAAIATRSDIRRAVEVIASGGRVTATESAFNVRCEGNTVVTTCVSGALDVRLRTGSATLGPGQQIVYSPDGLGPVRSIDPAEVTSWKDGILVNQSRVFTLEGGDMTVVSLNGNIDAGKGAKTVQAIQPPSVSYDDYGNITITPYGPSSGSGLAVLRAEPDVPLGNADLIAMNGFVDAGDAGIRTSGNLNIAAVAVLNANNITVGGKTTGVPVIQPPPVASLTSANNTAGAAAKSDTPASSGGAKEQPSIIIVEVLGYGGGDSSPGNDAAPSQQNQDPSKKRPEQQGYNANSPYQVLGAGDMTIEEAKQIIAERRQMMQQ